LKNLTYIFLFFVGTSLFSQKNHVEFRENKGQWNSNVLYKARIPGGNLYLEQNELTYQFYNEEDLTRIDDLHHGFIKNPQHQDSIIRMHAFKAEFLNSINTNLSPSIARFDYENYFIGNDQTKWASRVKKYEVVKYQEIYEKIGLQFYVKNNFLKYDFNVMIGGDPQKIKINYKGVDSIYIKDENLYIKTSVNEIIEQKPYAYQIIRGKEKEVKCRFILKNDTLSFELPRGYKEELPLIIDPALVFASYSGSTVDNWGYTSTFNEAGNLYGGGVSFGTGYPITTGAYQELYGGGQRDISITKFSPDGAALIYSTYLGGNNYENPHSLIVNNNDELLIFGTTNSTNFPVSINGADTSQNGAYDMFVAKLNASGTVLLGSTYIGGTGNDGLNNVTPLKYNYADDHRGEIIIDANDDVYVGSVTQSLDFPITGGTIQPTSAGQQDACIFKISSDLTTLNWSTYLGGDSTDAAYSLQLDDVGNILVTGGTVSSNFPTTAGVVQPTFQGYVDGWITKLNNNASSILASTYVGTSNYDQAFFVQLDTANNVYVVGQTTGAYPITPPSVYNNPGSGQFIHKFTPDLSTTVFSTTFGTSSGFVDIALSAFLVNECNYILVSGWGGQVNYAYSSATSSTTTGLPITANAIQSTTDGSDYYLTMFSEDADTLLFATFFGGNASPDHVDGGTSRFDKKGIVYQAVCASCGSVPNTDFPTTPGAWSNIQNGNNCNLGVFKIDLTRLTANAEVYTTPFYCIGDTIDFQNLSNGGITYYWDFADGNSSTLFEPSHVYDSIGTYTVMLIALDSISCVNQDTDYVDVFIGGPPTAIISPINGICRGDSTQLNISGGVSYAWSPNYNISNDSTSNPIVWPDTTTIYTVISSDSCGSDTNQIAIIVYQKNISVIPDFSICWGQSVQIYATGGINYLWSPALTLNNPNIENPTATPLTTTSYTVYITDINGCSWDTSMIITTDSVLPLASASNDTLICLGDTVNLIASGGVNYSWIPTNGIINSNNDTISISPTQNTQYIVDVSNACGIDFDTVDVIVQSPIVFAWPDTTICPNKEVQLFASGGNVINWSSQANIYQNNGNYFSSPNAPSSYTVTVEDSLGCRAQASLNIGMNPPPFVNAGIDMWLFEDSLILTANGVGDFVWTPTELVFCDTCQSTTTLPDETTTYTVILTDSLGCINYDQVTIYVTSELWIPNAFTPNGDGTNDVFFVKTLRISKFELFIFDRWGELLFYTDDKTQGWDGFYKGTLAKTESYVWKIKYEGLDGKPGKRYGTVTLLK
jgi:gliding motility-associated-like protein